MAPPPDPQVSRYQGIPAIHSFLHRVLHGNHAFPSQSVHKFCKPSFRMPKVLSSTAQFLLVQFTSVYLVSKTPPQPATTNKNNQKTQKITSFPNLRCFLPTFSNQQIVFFFFFVFSMFSPPGACMVRLQQASARLVASKPSSRAAAAGSAVASEASELPGGARKATLPGTTSKQQAKWTQK